MKKLWITLPILFFVMIAQEVNADESEIECLAQNIYHEARSESTAGRMAVALAEVMYTYETEDFTEGALWYHSPKVKPKWSMVYNKTIIIDNHIFYKDVD